MFCDDVVPDTDQAIFIYGEIEKAGLFCNICDACIEADYEVCSNCNLFRVKDYIIENDPYIMKAHPLQPHVWVHFTTDFRARRPYDVDI